MNSPVLSLLLWNAALAGCEAPRITGTDQLLHACSSARREMGLPPRQMTGLASPQPHSHHTSSAEGFPGSPNADEAYRGRASPSVVRLNIYVAGSVGHEHLASCWAVAGDDLRQSRVRARVAGRAHEASSTTVTPSGQGSAVSPSFDRPRVCPLAESRFLTQLCRCRAAVRSSPKSKPSDRDHTRHLQQLTPMPKQAVV